MHCNGLPASSLATALLVLMCHATAALAGGNYDALIQDIGQRSRYVHDSFMNTPGIRDQVGRDLGGFTSDDEGYLTSADGGAGDPDAMWQRVLHSVGQARQNRADELREHREKMRADGKMFDSPFLLEDEEEEEPVSDVEPKSAEVPYKNHLWGAQKVSGGSGKSPMAGAGGGGADGNQPATFEVKTDKLPGYCDPPNPCPIGVDPETLHSPCDKGIVNSKDFNKQYIWDKMVNGECSCDREHMHQCPRTEARDYSPISEEEEKRSNIHRAVVKKAGPYSAF